MDMKLEVVVVPVSDVDRAKEFYETAGSRMDIDHVGGDDFRVVQLTPPGSECSIIIGEGITSATPGSLEGLQLVATDVEEARAEFASRGVDVGEVFHDRGGIFYHLETDWQVGARIRNAATTARLPPSAIRTATAGSSKR
jgi:catechol 2,3-dioxygenase-like lactoylglutathione lyase family enzyme